MGVVINDFEVLPDTRGAQQRDAKSGAQAEGDGDGGKPDHADIEIALRDIDRRALRVWSY